MASIVAETVPSMTFTPSDSVASRYISPSFHEKFTRFWEHPITSVFSFSCVISGLVLMLLSYFGVVAPFYDLFGVVVAVLLIGVWFLRYHPSLIHIVVQSFPFSMVAVQMAMAGVLWAILFSDQPLRTIGMISAFTCMVAAVALRDAAVAPRFRKRILTGFVMAMNFPIIVAIGLSMEWFHTQNVIFWNRTFRIHSLIGDRFITVFVFFVKNLVTYLMDSSRLVTVNWPLRISREPPPPRSRVMDHHHNENENENENNINKNNKKKNHHHEKTIEPEPIERPAAE